MKLRTLSICLLFGWIVAVGCSAPSQDREPSSPQFSESIPPLSADPVTSVTLATAIPLEQSLQQENQRKISVDESGGKLLFSYENNDHDPSLVSVLRLSIPVEVTELLGIQLFEKNDWDHPIQSGDIIFTPENDEESQSVTLKNETDIRKLYYQLSTRSGSLSPFTKLIPQEMEDDLLLTNPNPNSTAPRSLLRIRRAESSTEEVTDLSDITKASAVPQTETTENGISTTEESDSSAHGIQFSVVLIPPEGLTQKSDTDRKNRLSKHKLNQNSLFIDSTRQGLTSCSGTTLYGGHSWSTTGYGIRTDWSDSAFSRTKNSCGGNVNSYLKTAIYFFTGIPSLQKRIQHRSASLENASYLGISDSGRAYDINNIPFPGVHDCQGAVSFHSVEYTGLYFANKSGSGRYINSWDTGSASTNVYCSQ